MQSSDRNDFTESQSRADSAFHIPNTVSSTYPGALRLPYDPRAGLVGGPQEPSGALLADEVGRLAVEEHRAAADEYRVHSVVISVHHAGQAAVLVDPVLGVGVQ